MKGTRLIAVTFMVLLIFACFISVPVFGENPWDADNSGGSESQADTTGHDNDTLDQQLTIVVNNPYPDWLSGMLFQLSYQFLSYFVVDSQPKPAAPQVAAE